jgi:hypothetical protein
MPTFTVQNIVDRAASQADMHDNYINATEWLAWFNYERRALAIDMARGATVREMTFTTVSAGQADKYTLAGEFLAVVGVWELKSDGRMRQLRCVPFENNFFQLQQGGGPIRGFAQTFSIEELNSTDAINVRFFPADLTNTYVIVTLNSPTVAMALTDSFSMPLGLEEKIVLELAKRALVKEESDISSVKDLLRSMEQKLEEYIWGRAFAQAPSVKNVDATQRGWGWGWDSNFVPPTPDMWTWL